MSTVTAQSTPAELAALAAAELIRLTGVKQHDAAVVLGSGWAPAADKIGSADIELPLDALPGFEALSAVGHVGRIRSVQADDRRVLIFLGRTHLYEGRGIEPVVHGVRMAAAAGCKQVVLTNAAGGLRDGMEIGQPVLISDHLNLTGRSPLVGATFVDLSDLYASRLRTLAAEVDSTLTEGVYAALPGPHYETPAEIRMLRTLGADLVGMSTALEAIAAHAAGLEVLGISLVTNLAAGLSATPLSHEEVLIAGKEAAERVGSLLADLVTRM